MKISKKCLFRHKFQLPNFENRGCVTINFPYGFSTVRMALQEPKNSYTSMIFEVR